MNQCLYYNVCCACPRSSVAWALRKVLRRPKHGATAGGPAATWGMCSKHCKTLIFACPGMLPAGSSPCTSSCTGRERGGRLSHRREGNWPLTIVPQCRGSIPGASSHVGGQVRWSGGSRCGNRLGVLMHCGDPCGYGGSHHLRPAPGLPPSGSSLHSSSQAAFTTAT